MLKKFCGWIELGALAFAIARPTHGRFRPKADSAGAREGAHDDLVLATAIALWWGKGGGREASSERISFEALRVRF